MPKYFGQWFTEICNELKSSGTLSELEAEFQRQVDDFGRIAVIRKQSFAKKNIEECYKRKCNKKSEEFRNLGNKEYAKKHFKDALSIYANSIIYAKERSREISLAYANRSAVLFSRNDFQLCIIDINLAFENGYPSKLCYKLYERLGRCYLALGGGANALNSFQDGLSSLKDSGLEISKKNEVVRGLFELCKQCEKYENELGCPVVDNFMYTVEAPLIPGDDINEIYPCASKSFSILHHEDSGRHAVASRDIPAGEIIIVEKAFTSICLPDCLETHCYHCLSRLNVYYPCRICVSVKFCSVGCEKTCWSTFHCYECSYFDLLSHDDIGLGHLALKMIATVGLTGLSALETRLKQNRGTEADKLGENEFGVFEPSDYYCVYSLVANSNKREPSDLFRRTLIAIYLSNILEERGFIKDGTDQDFDYCLIASHLLKQLQMLPCNAHEVSELRLEGEQVCNSELKEIGSAVYTTLSLLNHSCDPSVVRHCYGDTCVLRSVKYIKKGEPIVDNYGHLYPVEEKINRQKYLNEQYYFDCNCIACQENWPLYNEINQNDPEFLCFKCKQTLSNESGKCHQCGNVDLEVVNFDRLQDKYKSCVESVLDSGMFVDSLPTLLNYLNLISKKAQLPVIHLNNCQEIVKLCFGLQGNYFKV